MLGGQACWDELSWEASLVRCDPLVTRRIEPAHATRHERHGRREDAPRPIDCALGSPSDFDRGED